MSGAGQRDFDASGGARALSAATSPPVVYGRWGLPVGSIARLERGAVYVAVLLAPFATFRFSDLFFTVSDMFFCISLVLLILAARIPTAPLGPATPLWVLSFTLLFTGLLASSIAHGQVDRGLIVSAQYLSSYMLLLIILVREELAMAHRLAAIFLVSMIVIDSHGIFIFYTVGFEPGESGEIRGGIVSGGKRLATVLRNPNLAAMMNALTLPILLYFWFSKRLASFLAIPLLAVMFWTAVLTSSNSGLAAVCLSLIVFSALVMSRGLLLRLCVIGGVAIAGSFFAGGTDLLPPTFQKRVLGALSSGDVTEAGTFTSRAALIDEAIEMIGTQGIALVGIGADQFREKSAHRVAVHNLYLLLWAEGGLPALVGWLLFPGVGFLSWLWFRAAGVDPYARAALITTIVVFLMVAMFYPHLYARYWTMPMLLTLGIGYAHWQTLRAAASGPV